MRLSPARPSLPDTLGASGRLSPFHPAVAAPIGGVVVAELFLFFGRVDLTLWAHFLTILGCVFAPMVTDEYTDVFEVLALVPLFRLVNLGMPTFFELTVYWFPLVYAPLLPAIYVVSEDHDAVSLVADARRSAKLFVPALVMGAGLSFLEYSILEPEGLIASLSLWNLLVLSVVMFCFVGFVEELLFRGVLQRALEERLGHWSGLLIASALFGLLHSAYAAPAEVLYAGAIGLIFGVVYDNTDSLVAVTVAHGALNVFLFCVIPLGGLL
jgi:hypothetical protein